MARFLTPASSPFQHQRLSPGAQPWPRPGSGQCPALQGNVEPKHAVLETDAVLPGGGSVFTCTAKCLGLTVSTSGLRICWLVPHPRPHRFGVGTAFATLSSVQSPLSLAISSLLRVVNPVLLAFVSSSGGGPGREGPVLVACLPH